MIDWRVDTRVEEDRQYITLSDVIEDKNISSVFIGHIETKVI